MKLSQVVVSMLTVVLEIKKIVLAGVPGLALPGAHIVHPIAIKF